VASYVGGGGAFLLAAVLSTSLSTPHQHDTVAGAGAAEDIAHTTLRSIQPVRVAAEMWRNTRNGYCTIRRVDIYTASGSPVAPPPPAVWPFIFGAALLPRVVVGMSAAATRAPTNSTHDLAFDAKRLAPKKKAHPQYVPHR